MGLFGKADVGDDIGLYDVNTGKSLKVERYVDLGSRDDGEHIGLAYTTASHGRLVQIRSGCGTTTYDVDGGMLDEDADRVEGWLSMDGTEAVKMIRENAIPGNS